MVGEPVLLQDRPGPARGLTLNFLPGQAGGLTGGGTGITHPKVRVIGLAGHHIREDGVGRKLQRLAPGWGLQGSCVTHPAGGPAPPWPRQEPVGERKPRCSPPSPPAAGELVSAGCGHHWGFRVRTGVLWKSPHRAPTQDPLEGPSAASSPRRRGDSTIHPQGCC